MIRASELKKGRVVEYQGQLYAAHAVVHVTRGNWRSYIQAKLKAVRSGQIIDVRFSVDDKLETPFVETKPYEYLYKQGDHFVLMDPQNYDQIPISAEDMGEAEQYLKGNEQVTCSFIDGKLVSVELPNVVELAVTDTPPVARGATATNQTKDATLETGLSVKVPPFIEIGEVIRVDTRTGEYLERAKK